MTGRLVRAGERDAARHASDVGPGGVEPGEDRRTPTPGGESRLEEIASALEASGDYRVLRKLRPRTPNPGRILSSGERIGIILDTETTGLDPATDEVIEIAMVSFVYDSRGRVVDVLDEFQSFRQPTKPIPEPVTRLTGITDAMVATHAVDEARLGRLLDQAAVVIAHNAAFDRPFCERLAPAFAGKPWACSWRQVDWSVTDAGGARLGQLLAHQGLFHRSHRAIDDCHALLEILAAPLVGGVTALATLLEAARRPSIRIWAAGAPFDARTVLRGRGYKWHAGRDGSAPAWRIEVEERMFEAEADFLHAHVYRGGASFRSERLTASIRFKA